MDIGKEQPLDMDFIESTRKTIKDFQEWLYDFEKGMDLIDRLSARSKEGLRSRVEARQSTNKLRQHIKEQQENMSMCENELDKLELHVKLKETMKKVINECPDLLETCDLEKLMPVSVDYLCRERREIEALLKSEAEPSDETLKRTYMFLAHMEAYELSELRKRGAVPPTTSGKELSKILKPYKKIGGATTAELKRALSILQTKKLIRQEASCGEDE